MPVDLVVCLKPLSALKISRISENFAFWFSAWLDVLCPVVFQDGLFYPFFLNRLCFDVCRSNVKILCEISAQNCQMLVSFFHVLHF